MAESQKLSWARPLGALTFSMTVLLLYAYGKPIPEWAAWTAPLMNLTWFVDRSLWKVLNSRKKPPTS